MHTNYRNATGSEVGDGRYGNPTLQFNGRIMPESLPEPDPQVSADQSRSSAVLAFLAEFVLFVKHRRTYPPEHPLIAASSSKALGLLQEVLSKQEELTVGVAKQGLFVGKSFMEPYNQRFKLLAGILLEHGIATITFNRLTSAADLQLFTGLLEIKPARLWQMGGAGEVLAASGVSAIQVMSVNPDYFLLREESELPVDNGDEADGSLWETFLRSLGEEGLLPGAGADFPEAAELARILSEASASGIDLSGRLFAAQKKFVDGIPPQLLVYNSRSLEQILRFVGSLSPRLRKLFLMNLFGVSPDKAAFVETLAAGLPKEAILDALRSASSESYVPPLVQRLMAKLASVSTAPDGGGMRLNNETDEKMRSLFRKDQIDKYVPEEYRETLVSLLSAELLPDTHEEEIVALLGTLEADCIERKTVDMIFELVRNVPMDGMTDGLTRNLRELADYFLETGDFKTLGKICENLRDVSTLPSALRFVAEMREFVASPAFTGSLFDSLELWGKEKRSEITAFICKIGPFIIPALFDRLAEETNMSLRRYYMDRLMELGTTARDAAMERLGDSRWYFVRNLIILLRSMNDPVGIERIRSLSTHPNPKIREEVLNTFRNCGEAVGEEVLLRELDADERARVLKSVRMAESSRSDAVMAKLLEIVSASPFAGFDLELKKAAVKALAGRGNPKALPSLEQFLNSRNLLRPILHNRLKLEIIRSLDRYPVHDILPLLERITRFSNSEVSKLAALMLRERTKRKAA